MGARPIKAYVARMTKARPADLELSSLAVPLSFVGVVIAASLASDRFLSATNIANVLEQAAVIGIIAAGSTLVIVLAEIDLSVGSVVGLAAVFAAGALRADLPPLLAMGAGIGIGVVVGLLNGVLVAVIGLPSFIVTLGTMLIGRGLIQSLLQGAPISGFGPEFRWIGAGQLLGLPAPVFVAILTFLALHVLVTRTGFGRELFAVGGNAVASRYAGLRVRRIRLTAFAICGALAGLAGVVLMARVDVAQPNGGTGYEFAAIGAVILGGADFFGGRGSIIGTALGVLIVTIVANVLVLLNISALWGGTAQGLIIIAALLLQWGKQR